MFSELLFPRILQPAVKYVQVEVSSFGTECRIVKMAYTHWQPHEWQFE